MAADEHSPLTGAFPIEEVDRLKGELRHLEDKLVELRRGRDRLLLDLRHAYERIQFDLEELASQAFTKIPHAMADGDESRAFALTVKGMAAWNASRTPFHLALNASREDLN